MVLEIALWAFVPRGNPTLLFWVFVINRILSGMAEAAASGTDEALAYDSLQKQGKSQEWGRVLERQIQCQSAGFVIAMTIGGILYDPDLLQRLFNWAGFSLIITSETTLRLPIYMTLVSAVLVLLTTLGMREVEVAYKLPTEEDRPTLGSAFLLVWQAGRWIFKAPFVLAIMLFGLLGDILEPTGLHPAPGIDRREPEKSGFYCLPPLVCRLFFLLAVASVPSIRAPRLSKKGLIKKGFHRQG